MRQKSLNTVPLTCSSHSQFPASSSLPCHDGKMQESNLEPWPHAAVQFATNKSPHSHTHYCTHTVPCCFQLLCVFVRCPCRQVLSSDCESLTLCLKGGQVAFCPNPTPPPPPITHYTIHSFFGEKDPAQSCPTATIIITLSWVPTLNRCRPFLLVSWERGVQGGEPGDHVIDLDAFFTPVTALLPTDALISNFILFFS